MNDGYTLAIRKAAVETARANDIGAKARAVDRQTKRTAVLNIFQIDKRYLLCTEKVGTTTPSDTSAPSSHHSESPCRLAFHEPKLARAGVLDGIMERRNITKKRLRNILPSQNHAIQVCYCCYRLDLGERVRSDVVSSHLGICIANGSKGIIK